MTCPYCNKDMTKGRLVSSRKVTWIHPIMIVGNTGETNDVVPPGSSFWRMSKIPTYYCENCKKMNIDCDSEVK